MASDTRLLVADDIAMSKTNVKVGHVVAYGLACGILLGALSSGLHGVISSAIKVPDLDDVLLARPRLGSSRASVFGSPSFNRLKTPADLHWSFGPKLRREAGKKLAAEPEMAREPEHWAGRLSGADPPTPNVQLPEAPPFLVLPGFGNDAIDYVAPLQQPEEVGLVAALRRRGVKRVEVVPIERSNWFNVLRGLLDINFLRGDAQPDGPAFMWYLNKARASVEQAVAAQQLAHPESSDARVVLIGHSAGGWLARALCLNETWAREHVRGIVSLGTPHLGPPADVVDQTRGTVNNLNRRSPGAFLGAPFFYVTVASDRILGDVNAPEGSAARVAFNSYLMVCGEGAVPGDGVVPLNSAHLDGATQLTLNCYHSINEPATAKPTDEWYCAEPFIDDWLSVVATALNL
eukprot:gnl/TRDRNA2_/TRDRNA2_141939_c0_seq1.p1 gnl/TRDRNA2_/TRDRNA2_141939_c0~~gnl/TRDRNA2_/TRDRNA2_141939_c0_seq1.p1  ORF type:complete len:405 (-),score=63.67 gnl/TRDRNA2_/TRDRNA2_141939_c0_seq1:41-1255(-)